MLNVCFVPPPSPHGNSFEYMISTWCWGRKLQRVDLWELNNNLQRSRQEDAIFGVQGVAAETPGNAMPKLTRHGSVFRGNAEGSTLSLMLTDPF